MKKLLVVMHRAPYSGEQPGEMLDAALVAAAFGMDVSLLFQGDGVWQLLAGQNGKALERKTLLAQLQALELYDIQRLYVDSASLAERGLDSTPLGLAAETLDEARIRQLHAGHDLVLRA